MHSVHEGTHAVLLNLQSPCQSKRADQVMVVLGKLPRARSAGSSSPCACKTISIPSRAVAMCMPYSRYVLKTCSALWQKFIELHEVRAFGYERLQLFAEYGHYVVRQVFFGKVGLVG